MQTAFGTTHVGVVSVTDAAPGRDSAATVAKPAAVAAAIACCLEVPWSKTPRDQGEAASFAHVGAFDSRGHEDRVDDQVLQHGVPAGRADAHSQGRLRRPRLRVAPAPRAPRRSPRRS